LGINPPVDMTSDEISALLIKKLKEQRSNPDIRLRFKELMNDLEKYSGSVSERPPAFGCEILSPKRNCYALADNDFVDAKSELAN